MTPSMIENYMDAHFNDYTTFESRNITNVSANISGMVDQHKHETV